MWKHLFIFNFLLHFSSAFSFEKFNIFCSLNLHFFLHLLFFSRWFLLHSDQKNAFIHFENSHCAQNFSLSWQFFLSIFVNFSFWGASIPCFQAQHNSGFSGSKGEKDPGWKSPMQKRWIVPLMMSQKPHGNECNRIQQKLDQITLA